MRRQPPSPWTGILLTVVAATFSLPGTARADDRVPIAVMDLVGRGVDETAAAALTTEVSNTLAGLRVFRVITREDIKRMMQLEQTRQACTGAVDAACMAEIGGALGVDYLVYGEISKIAETYSLSLTMLDIGKAEAANRVNRKVSEAGQLLGESEVATKLLAQPLLADRKGFLVLDVAEVGAKVAVDGRTMGITPLAGRIDLNMGAHEVTVEKEGFLIWAKTVDVPPSQAAVEVVSLVPSQAFIAEYESSAATSRFVAWVTAGSAVALLGTGVALRLVSDARFEDLKTKGLVQQGPACAGLNPNYNGTDYCPTMAGYDDNVLKTVDSIERMDTIALVGLIAGGVSAVASLYLFVSGDDPGRYSAYSAGPVAGEIFFLPGLGQGVLTGRF